MTEFNQTIVNRLNRRIKDLNKIEKDGWGLSEYYKEVINELNFIKTGIAGEETK